MSTHPDPGAKRATRAVPLVLLLLGLLRMAGDVTGVPALEGLGAACGASPAPKVFSVVQGLETYSTRFYLEWTDRTGELRRLELTPEVYGSLRGPYNRRNMYGAALAYGPVLATNDRTRSLFRAVAGYALCGDAPVLRELGVDPQAMAGNVTVRYEPVQGTDLGDLPGAIEAPCPPAQ